MLHRRLLLTLAAIAAVACGDDTSSPPSKIVNFSASLTPGGEPGALNGNPSGSGTFTATLDTSTTLFTWTGQFSGLTTNINNGHIHGPFTPGSTGNAGVLLDFNPARTAGSTFTGLNSAAAGAVSGSVALNTFTANANINGDSVRKLILAGAVYVNIHTTSNPGGEIRGQLVRQP